MALREFPSLVGAVYFLGSDTQLWWQHQAYPMSIPNSQKQMKHKLVKISGKNSRVLAISGEQAVAARERVFDKLKSGS